MWYRLVCPLELPYRGSSNQKILLDMKLVKELEDWDLKIKYKKTLQF
jgi:hypothetical protein